MAAIPAIPLVFRDNTHYGMIITYRRHKKSIITGKRKAGLMPQSIHQGPEIPFTIKKLGEKLRLPYDACHYKKYPGGTKSRWLPDILTPITQLVIVTGTVVMDVRRGKETSKVTLQPGETYEIQGGIHYKILPTKGMRVVLTYRQNPSLPSAKKEEKKEVKKDEKKEVKKEEKKEEKKGEKKKTPKRVIDAKDKREKVRDEKKEDNDEYFSLNKQTP